MDNNLTESCDAIKSETLDSIITNKQLPALLFDEKGVHTILDNTDIADEKEDGEISDDCSELNERQTPKISIFPGSKAVTPFSSRFKLKSNHRFQRYHNRSFEFSNTENYVQMLENYKKLQSKIDRIQKNAKNHLERTSFNNEYRHVPNSINRIQDIRSSNVCWKQLHHKSRSIDLNSDEDELDVLLLRQLALKSVHKMPAVNDISVKEDLINSNTNIQNNLLGLQKDQNLITESIPFFKKNSVNELKMDHSLEDHNNILPRRYIDKPQARVKRRFNYKENLLNLRNDSSVSLISSKKGTNKIGGINIQYSQSDPTINTQGNLNDTDDRVENKSKDYFDVEKYIDRITNTSKTHRFPKKIFNKYNAPIKNVISKKKKVPTATLR